MSEPLSCSAGVILDSLSPDRHRPTTLEFCVYLLIDPRTAEVRYVGVTTMSLADRLRRHLSSARKGERCHRANWLRALESLGLKPAILPVETNVSIDRESFWIAHYRAAGASLTNMTNGGDGTWGYKFDQETIERCHRARRGVPLSEEHRQKIAEASKRRGNPHQWGRPLSEEHRKNIGDGNRGKKHQRRQPSGVPHGNKGRPKSQDHRQQIAEKGQRDWRGLTPDQQKERMSALWAAAAAARQRKREAISGDQG